MPKPNIYLIIIDSFRKDRLNKNTSPFLYELSKSQFSFDQAIAPGTWTLPSFVSFFSGKYPFEHQIHERFDIESIEARETLIHDLKVKEYNTVAFTSSNLVEKLCKQLDFDDIHKVKTSYNLLFEDALNPYDIHFKPSHSYLDKILISLKEVHDSEKIIKSLLNIISIASKTLFRKTFAHFGFQALIQTPDEIIGQKFKEYNNQKKSHPSFYLIHLTNTHRPWRFNSSLVNKIVGKYSYKSYGNSKKWSRISKFSKDRAGFSLGKYRLADNEIKILNNLYNSSIYHADQITKQIVNHIKPLKSKNSDIVIITSDHGECINDHGILGHVGVVSKEVAHVPLIVMNNAITHEENKQPMSLKNLHGLIQHSINSNEIDNSYLRSLTEHNALTHSHGYDPANFNEKFDNKKSALSLNKRIALYTTDSWIEKRDDNQYKGDLSLKIFIDKFEC